MLDHSGTRSPNRKPLDCEVCTSYHTTLDEIDRSEARCFLCGLLRAAILEFAMISDENRVVPTRGNPSRSAPIEEILRRATHQASPLILLYIRILEREGATHYQYQYAATLTIPESRPSCNQSPDGSNYAARTTAAAGVENRHSLLVSST